MAGKHRAKRRKRDVEEKAGQGAAGGLLLCRAAGGACEGAGRASKSVAWDEVTDKSRTASHALRPHRPETWGTKEKLENTSLEMVRFPLFSVE